MSSISILAPYLKETQKGLVLSGTDQDALHALFWDTPAADNEAEPRPEGIASS